MLYFQNRQTGGYAVMIDQAFLDLHLLNYIYTGL